jgi:hypothetical protein
MTISKERVEELRSIFLNNLRKEFEEEISYHIDELGKNPEKFFKSYYKTLMKDCMEERGLRSINGYIGIEFPLRLNDFTEEEIKYLEEDKRK